MSTYYKDDRNKQGQLTLVIVGGTFVYFTLVIIVIPLLEEDSSQALDRLFFPFDRFVLLAIPTIAGVLLASIVMISLGLVMLDKASRSARVI